MDPEDVAELTHEETTELLLGAWATNIKFGDMLETAWGIIAAADWDAPGHPQSWRMAAERWREGYHKNLVLIEDHTTDAADEPLLERMAKEVHDIWCAWMKYMFSKGLRGPEGLSKWSLNELARRRWVRQMETPYVDLSEKEKDSDREIAKRYLNIALTGKPEDAVPMTAGEVINDAISADWESIIAEKNENEPV